MGMSNRAYARHRGVSEAAVRKALKAGRISLGADGKIDPIQADAQWQANSDISKKRGTHSDNLSTQSDEHSAHLNKYSANAPYASFNASDNKKNNQKNNDNTEAYQRAKTAAEIIKVKIGKLELQILNGDLVDRKVALDQVFASARQERDSWLNWPARISAEWAASLGIDEQRVYQDLMAIVRQQLFLMAGHPHGDS